MTSDARLGSSPDPVRRQASPLREAPARHTRSPAVPIDDRWEIRYRYSIIVSDLAAIAVVVPIGHLLRIGDDIPLFGGILSPWLGVIAGILVAASLPLSHAWDPRTLGQGFEEFRRLGRGVGSAAVVIGLAGLALQVGAVRPWVFGLVPLMGVLCLIGRYALRKRLHRRRAEGTSVHSGLVVGSPEAAGDLIERTRRDPHNGWVVRAVCTPTGRGPGGAADILGVPVIGDLDSVPEVMRGAGFRIVAIARGAGWTPSRMHGFAWDLENEGADLLVDPGLMEFAGPRMHVSPVDGLPLLRLTRPALDGWPGLVKTIADRVGAAAGLLVLTPLLVVIAVAIALDGGPVLFRQTRVGRGGQTFRMLKFRSMVVDAERFRAELQDHNEGSGPLFKMRHDPRVTPVGTLLRRHSLDELPQLVNVLTGSMSLVGPRPPLPEEVATYGRAAHRKLGVRPGLTGLWQVSGRSRLSWEEAVRLDLRYVENWSLALDVVILWKSVGAVVRGDGAY